MYVRIFFHCVQNVRNDTVAKGSHDVYTGIYNMYVFQNYGNNNTFVKKVKFRDKTNGQYCKQAACEVSSS